MIRVVQVLQNNKKRRNGINRLLMDKVNSSRRLRESEAETTDLRAQMAALQQEVAELQVQNERVGLLEQASDEHGRRTETSVRECNLMMVFPSCAGGGREYAQEYGTLQGACRYGDARD
jgi:uncharacterized protein YhaN